MREAEPIDGDLSVLELDEAYLVVIEDDPDDWLVRFEKAEGFDAAEWAGNMTNVYNKRRGGPTLEARYASRPVG